MHLAPTSQALRNYVLSRLQKLLQDDYAERSSQGSGSADSQGSSDSEDSGKQITPRESPTPSEQSSIIIELIAELQQTPLHPIAILSNAIARVRTSCGPLADKHREALLTQLVTLLQDVKEISTPNVGSRNLDAFFASCARLCLLKGISPQRHDYIETVLSQGIPTVIESLVDVCARTLMISDTSFVEDKTARCTTISGHSEVTFTSIINCWVRSQLAVLTNAPGAIITLKLTLGLQWILPEAKTPSVTALAVNIVPVTTRPAVAPGVMAFIQKLLPTTAECRNFIEGDDAAYYRVYQECLVANDSSLYLDTIVIPDWNRFNYTLNNYDWNEYAAIKINFNNAVTIPMKKAIILDFINSTGFVPERSLYVANALTQAGMLKLVSEYLRLSIFEALPKDYFLNPSVPEAIVVKGNNTQLHLDIKMRCPIISTRTTQCYATIFLVAKIELVWPNAAVKFPRFNAIAIEVDMESLNINPPLKAQLLNCLPSADHFQRFIALQPLIVD